MIGNASEFSSFLPFSHFFLSHRGIIFYTAQVEAISISDHGGRGLLGSRRSGKTASDVSDAHRRSARACLKSKSPREPAYLLLKRNPEISQCFLDFLNPFLSDSFNLVERAFAFARKAAYGFHAGLAQSVERPA